MTGEPHASQTGEPQAPQTLIVTVGHATYGGTCTATLQRDPAAAPLHLDVPYTIEGERAQVTITGEASRRTNPNVGLDSILAPSPHRITPRCLHFGICGGCQYQHMPDALQLHTKSAILQRLLEATGVPAPTPQLHAGPPYAYRNRMRLRLQDNRIGYNRRASNTFLPIQQCPIVSPLLWQTAAALNGAPLPAGTTEAELFATAEDTAVQLTLHLDADVTTIDRDAPAAFRALCTGLANVIPQLVGAGLLVHAPATPGTSRRIQQRQRIEISRWGQPDLPYVVDDRTYTVSRGAFFQVNRFLTGTLVDIVLGNRTGNLALDLFAGAGLFSLPLTQRFHQVIAVEVGQPAATDLNRLLQLQGPQHRAIPQTTLAFLKSYKGAPDLVVLDPPRAGIGTDALRALLKLAPAEIVYISCDPTTFARDARSLVDSRYAVEELHLVDLFPQTFHMETVAVFRSL